MPTRERGLFGNLLRYWRTVRRYSQLQLSVEAGISSRHLSFLETGRASPSREMILLLTDVLEIPLRERNTMMTAAGYAATYSQSSLDDPELAAVRRSIEFILKRHNPYPALLMDRCWNILLQNDSALRLFHSLMAEPEKIALPFNAIKLVFDPNGIRPCVIEWEKLACSLIQRVHRDVAATPDDESSKTLLDELLRVPGVPADFRQPDYGAEHPVLHSLQVEKDGCALHFFSTLTTLGTPLDVTLQELRLETFFPADEKTGRFLQESAKP